MTACIICGAECPPRRVLRHGGLAPRKLCGSDECKRLRQREREGKPRELLREMSGCSRDYASALKALRRLADRRALKLCARATSGAYRVEVMDGESTLFDATGAPLDAIRQAHDWLRGYRLAEARPRQVTKQAKDFKREEWRMSAADYAWGAA